MTESSDSSATNVCDVCGVDHRYGSADLSHGLVHLLIHSTERFDWVEHPINGDHLALQRAGILPPSMLWSTDWEQLGEHLNIRDVGDADPMRRPFTDCATCDGGGCGDCA